MDLGSHSVLITGGTSGIGLALAERFLQAGSTVAICGRRENRLREAQQRHPRLRIMACDLSKPSDRVSLRDWAVRELPGLDMLVNNAGVQQRIRATDPADWDRAREEIVTNFEAPVHLTMLFLPHLVAQLHATIVNTTSGLAFSPLAAVPVYSATKAAMRSFTLSLRQQLSGTSVRVVELIPPAVDTDLGGPGLHTFGVPLEAFITAAVTQLENNAEEITYGQSTQASRASREELDALFTRMNQRSG
jgi:uncharacterized oxidoreductase